MGYQWRTHGQQFKDVIAAGKPMGGTYTISYPFILWVEKVNTQSNGHLIMYGSGSAIDDVDKDSVIIENPFV